MRPRLQEFDNDDDDVDTPGEGFVPSVKIFRKPPPVISGASEKPKSNFKQDVQENKKQYAEAPVHGDRFELNLSDNDDFPSRAPLAKPRSLGVLKEIKERTIKSTILPSQAPQSTGFPVVTRRKDGASSTKESKFKASLRQQQGQNTKEAVSVTAGQPSAANTLTPNLQPRETSLPADIDAENSQIINGMTEPDILDERARLMEMLGGDMVDFLLKRQGGPVLSHDHAKAGTAVVTSEGPAEADRRVHFSGDVSCSASSSRTSSPPPPQRNDASMGTWLENAFANVDMEEDDSRQTGTSDARQRRFPQQQQDASSDRPEDFHENVGSEKTVRFDIQGQAIIGTLSEMDHSNEIENHAGNGQPFTIKQLLRLSRSSVAAQRSLAMEILRKAASKYLPFGDSPAQIALSQSETVNQIIATCNRGFADKHLGLVITSLSIMHLYANTPLTVLNTAAAILTIQPSPLNAYSRFLSTTTSSVTLPRESHIAILLTLHALASTDEDFVSTEIVETPLLLENLTRTFLQVHWPNDDASLPVDSAIQLLCMLTSRNRANAESLVSRRIEKSLLRYIAIPPWSHSDDILKELSFKLATSTLRLLCEYARYGLGCSTLSISRSLFRVLEHWLNTNVLVDLDFSKGWFDLLESWSVCAIDPHSTIPEHDLLWAETKDWGDHCYEIAFEATQDLPLVIWASIIRALASWLEGAKIHDRVIYAAMQQKVINVRERLSRIISQASEEPITMDKARILLALQKLVKISEIKEMLEEGGFLLDRVQIEQLQLPATSEKMEADGWI